MVPPIEKMSPQLRTLRAKLVELQSDVERQRVGWYGGTYHRHPTEPGVADRLVGQKHAIDRVFTLINEVARAPEGAAVICRFVGYEHSGFKLTPGTVYHTNPECGIYHGALQAGGTAKDIPPNILEAVELIECGECIELNSKVWVEVGLLPAQAEALAECTQGEFTVVGGIIEQTCMEFAAQVKKALAPPPPPEEEPQPEYAGVLAPGPVTILPQLGDTPPKRCLALHGARRCLLTPGHAQDHMFTGTPLLGEADPELERLLDEEAEIERRTREHHETIYAGAPCGMRIPGTHFLCALIPLHDGPHNALGGRLRICGYLSMGRVCALMPGHDGAHIFGNEICMERSPEGTGAYSCVLRKGHTDRHTSKSGDTW